MLVETFSLVRDLPRVQEISSVLIRHGLGELVRRLGLVGMIERAGQMLHWQTLEHTVQLDPAVRMRLAMEELGPAFIKLGQLFATRVDVFPANWIEEFEKLQDSVPPVPFESLLPELEEALGISPFAVFKNLNTVPLAAASIAQVHTAELPDGTPVVLKIRRPGVTAKVEADLRILFHLAHLVEVEFPESRRYRPRTIINQFARSLRRELDLAMESRHMTVFAKNFAAEADILIPKVYWDYTSAVVNVQERIFGVAGNDLEGARAAGLDLKLLAARGADAVLRMILVDGFFHADPHPGNVFYLPDNRLALVDFGMVGRVTELRRNQIADLLAGIARADHEAVLDILLDWSGGPEVDHGRVLADIGDLMFVIEGAHLKDLQFGTILFELTSIMREHALVLPSDLTLLFKTFITLEGLGRQLDPDFHMVSHFEPFVRKVVTDRYKPEQLLERGRKNLRSLLGLAVNLPRDLGQLVKNLRRGRVGIDLDLKRLDTFGREITLAANRLTMGILTASLVIGSSIVMTVQGGPTVFGLPFFGFIGFTIAFFNGLWLILSIWRSGKG